MQTNSSSKIPVFLGDRSIAGKYCRFFSEKLGQYFNRVQKRYIGPRILAPVISYCAEFFQRFQLAAANRPFKFKVSSEYMNFE